MGILDIALAAVVLLSTLAGFARGLVRTLFGLAAWIVGIVVAIRYADGLGAMLPDFGTSPAIMHAIAFALIAIVLLIAISAGGWVFAKMLRAVGLGFVDRLLGGVFGLARGLLFLVAFALVAGLTGMAKRDWWQNSAFAPMLAAIVLEMRPWMPPTWVERLDFGPPAAVKARGAAA